MAIPRENNLIKLEYIIAIVNGQSEGRLLFITMDSTSIPILLESLFGIGAFQGTHIHTHMNLRSANVA